MGSAAVLLAIITAVITGSRCFGHISDEPRGIIKSSFCAVLVPKSACCIYSQHNCIYTQGGMKALTTGSKKCLISFRDHIGQTGMPPTRAEIAQRLGFPFSTNAAENA